MRFSVGVAGADAAVELHDLREWVSNDPDLRAHVTTSYAAAAPDPEYMGATLELLEFAVTSGISIGSLIVSIAAWRDSRRLPPAVDFRDAKRQHVITMTASDEMTVKEITVSLNDGPAAGSTEA